MESDSNSDVVIVDEENDTAKPVCTLLVIHQGNVIIIHDNCLV